MSDLSKPKQKAVLISTILASSMAFIDSTALNVALPALQQDLNISGSELLWIVNGYALFLSALLLVGGSIGDIFGRKRVFGVGILFFTMSSIVCGVSTSPMMLIISRCVQGVGGALMVPGSLSLITALFPQNKRGWAIGTWSMFSAMTTVFGPALGGWLAGMGLWRVVFFINVPLALISLYFLYKIPESKELSAKKIDVLGAVLATLSLGGLTYGFIEAPNYGFDSSRIAISLAGGLLCLILFIIHEKRSSHPMMPLSLFQSKIFSSTNIITLFVYGALGGFLFFFPLNLIQVQGYPAEIAGLTMLPFGLLIAFMSRWSGAWADRVGVRPPLIIGPALTAIGFYLFSIPDLTTGPSEFWSTYLPAIIVLGVGMGITVAPLTTAVMGAVPQKNTGTASGVNNTISRTAGVLAIAVIGAFALISFENSLKERTQSLNLSAEVTQALEREIPKLAEAKPPKAATAVNQQKIEAAIDYAFIDSFKQSALIATILAGLSVFIAYFSIKR
ncbi:DHA2 family efflux MFS transporter permease subunit [Fulvivirga sp. RKSG066]|uniref:MFS transporter n=1 Tax=Fulvivirga aurantia TaxID=2529383 RepID=UPI0012BBBCD7|nr:MFS transporter [Fulvivirga aurantia]MTI21666.1 DHA2 family efflux MFS transporter permease subunit [Fulvivirga aurantia]